MTNRLFDKQDRKTAKTMITLFLLLAATATIFALPNASAHTPPLTIPTISFVSASPNPAGVGQTTAIVMWLNYIPPTGIGQYGDRWHGFTVEITKPDGSKQTLGPFTTDAAASAYTAYKPDQVGSYTIVAKFPGQVLTGENPPPPSATVGNFAAYRAEQGKIFINDTFSASTSDPVTLVVTQQQQVQLAWPEASLPTGYWQRPITTLNRQWASISGNYLSGSGIYGGSLSGFTTSLGVVAPYSTAPKSSHVVWTRPLQAGGIADGSFGPEGYWCGLPYQPASLTPPVVINGVVYFNVMTPPRIGWYAVDLRTGEELWFKNVTGPVQLGSASAGSNALPYRLPQLSFGQILQFESPNQDGAHPYLWSEYVTNYVNDPIMGPIGVNTKWSMYDAFSGNWICDINGVPAGTTVTGSDGSILKFSLSGSGANRRLLVWNSTQTILWLGTQQQWQAGDFSAFVGGGYWGWLPQIGVTFNASNGYFYNVSIPNVTGSIFAVREGVDVIGGTAGSNNGAGAIVQGNLWALNLDPAKGAIGKLLWNISYTPPVNHAPVIPSTTGALSGPTVYPNDGIFLFQEGQSTRGWYCYDLSTGQLKWGPTEKTDVWGEYGLSGVVYNGKLYSYGASFGYLGHVQCIDLTTGNISWDFASGVTSTEIGWPNTPITVVGAAEGILYVAGADTFTVNPYPRGFYLYALNATTGKVLWQIPFFASGTTSPRIAIADGYITASNIYDNQIYCFGKGQTATTVSAPDIVIPQGTPVLIKGIVTDQSPGDTCLGVPAAGTPAISDDSMSEWMQYLYMQQPKPTNATGVKVHLTAIDPNGNFQDIGTATSKADGTYAIDWTPPVPGVYHVTATFEGSNSYYSSSGAAYFLVGDAPSAAVTPTPTVTATPAVPSVTPSLTASPSASPSQAPPPATTDMTAIYIAIAAVVIIIAVVAAAIVLRRRK